MTVAEIGYEYFKLIVILVHSAIQKTDLHHTRTKKNTHTFGNIQCEQTVDPFCHTTIKYVSKYGQCC